MNMSDGLGPDPDIFVLDLDGARDEVTNFQDSIDQIGLLDGVTFDDLSIEDGIKGGVIIGYDGKAEMFLPGLNADQIDGTDFTDDFFMNS